ncbi:LOW QUALITY PROTEIN: testicular haploid expressed gene protein-like [Haliotis rubra]|uniref:LOW QUALITY PROTEIN: testicular haploid expressed gene protein-like n=1 Tax=Haliotis rubra TaxID=36100 RepID=UPI001EE60A09|nr:LOW QUALITY PROTEIN: testicular haploid expressed gene protein-like [Haliotis rubra]
MDLLLKELSFEYPKAIFSHRDAFTQTEPKSTRRIDLLSRPKPVPPGFLEDRRSVYWVDYEPQQPQGVTEGGTSKMTLFTTTTRLEELARHRSTHHEYKEHRPTPIWPVKKTALDASATERVEVLSQPKGLHGEFKIERSPYSVVTQAARSVSASKRLQSLAVPKNREDRYCINDYEWGQPSEVSPEAKKATASSRVESLAEAKGYHDNFKGENPVQWPVSDQALKAIASLRLQQLARPRSRTMIKDDYDPYKVTTAAKKARATPRMEELCAPIPRKVRQKKTLAAGQ